MPRHKNKPDDTVVDRELSPQSRLFVTPEPPRGTKRRPAKLSNMTDDFVSGSQNNSHGAFNHAACVAHIKSLNPKLNDHPLLDLNTAWLNNVDVALPLSADSRIHRHMHKYDSYNPGGGEDKVIGLVHELKKGTEIEHFEATEYRLIEHRVSDRFRFLSDALLRNGFIEKSDGKFSKTRAFLNVWKIKDTYWSDGELPKSETSHRREETRDRDDDIYDDYDTPPPSKKRSHLSTTNLTKSSASKNDDPADITRFGRRPGMSDGQGANRQRQLGTLGDATLVTHMKRNASRLEDSTQSFEDGQTVEDDTDGISAALDFLGSPVSPLLPITPLPRDRLPQEHFRHPITPTSPSQSVGTLKNGQRNSMTPVLGYRSSSIQSPSAPRQFLTPAPSPPGMLDMRINFFSAAGNYNPRNSLRDPQLDLFSLQTFFELLADRSGVPLASFDCLTLCYDFIGLNQVLIRKDATEDEWTEIKMDINHLYNYCHKRYPWKSDYGLWVDPGDTMTVKTEANLGDEQQAGAFL